MLARIWILIVKELQQVWRNKQSRQLLIVPVILQLLLFPFAVTMEVKNSTLGIMNEDGGAVSIELIQRFAAASAFPEVLVFYDDASLQAAIDNEDVALVIRFSPDFSAKVAIGEPVKIQAVVDGRSSNSAQIAFSYVQQIIQAYATEVSAQVPMAEMDIRHAYNPNLLFYWFVLPALVAIIATVGSLSVTALSLAREKEQGTMEQLLVTPLTTGYIMLGKAVPGVLVGLVQGAIVAVCAVIFYRVPMSGHWWLLFLAMLCYSLSVVGVGIFISTLCKTQQQAFLGLFAYMIPSVILSGFLGPTENMPPFLYALSRINPLSYFIDASQGIFLKYHTLVQAWPNMWPMLMIAVVTLSAAYTLFYRRTAV